MQVRLSFPKGICVSASGQTALVACLLLAPAPHAQSSFQHKLFTSREDGVTFLYPAAWLLNADDDAATAKLRLTDLAPPRAVVQLEGGFTGQGPYKDSDFDAGAFAYTILPAETETACFAFVEQLAGGHHDGTPTTLDHRSAREVRFTATVAGTEDIHRIAAVPAQKRCVLLETVLIRRSAGIAAHPLSTARWRQLESSFDTVLRSVHLSK